jgi:hypothetical protein
MKIVKRVPFVIVCFAVLCFGIVLAARMSARKAPPTPNAAQLKDIEELMQVKLPPSARTVAWTHGSAVGDWGILLKVEILPSDMSALITDSPFTQGSLTRKDALFYISGDPWWDEGGEAQQYMFGKASLPEDRELEMLVDMDRKDVYVVYFALFGG